jgi:hypothetical protein
MTSSPGVPTSTSSPGVPDTVQDGAAFEAATGAAGAGATANSEATTASVAGTTAQRRTPTSPVPEMDLVPM